MKDQNSSYKINQEEKQNELCEKISKISSLIADLKVLIEFNDEKTDNKFNSKSVNMDSKDFGYLDESSSNSSIVVTEEPIKPTETNTNSLQNKFVQEYSFIDHETIQNSLNFDYKILENKTTADSIPNIAENRSSLRDSNKYWTTSNNVDVIFNNREQRCSVNEMKNRLNISHTQVKEYIQELYDQPNGAIMLDEDLIILGCNKKFQSLFGYDKFDIVHSNIDKFISDDSYQILLENIIDDNDGKGVKILKLEFIQNNSSLKKQEVKLEPLYHQSNLEGIFIYLHQLEENDYNQSIDPRNTQYLIQSFMLFLIILFLAFQIPYDLAQIDQQTIILNSYLDIQLTVIFTFDILLNFILAQEIEEDYQEFGLIPIVYNQASTTLLFDIASTIPYNLFLTGFNLINTNILKGLKITKFFRIFKLMRLSKLFSVVNEKKMKRNEIFKFILEFQYRNIGIFELFQQNIYIIYFAHFYTCFYQQIKNNFLLIQGQDWLYEYYGISVNKDKFDPKFNPATNVQTNIDIQMVMVTENVKTALGLSVNRPFTRVEILFNLIWMFFGLSLFGQGIGNISAQINHSSKNELEMQEVHSYFSQIIVDNELSNEMNKAIFKDIEEYYEQYGEKQFQEQSKTLSKPVLKKLEEAIYAEFISSFPLLEKISLSGVRKLKNYAKFKNYSRTFNLNKNSNIDRAIFIIKGTIKIQDENMNLINEYKSGEIFGLTYFRKQQLIKYNFDLKDLFKHLLNGDVSDNVNVKLSINELNTNPYLHKIRKSKLTKPNSIKIDDDENFEIKQRNTIISSDDINYFEIDQKQLEDILLTDSYTFCMLWKQNLQSYELINHQEELLSISTIKDFNSNSNPGIIILEDGMIYDVNNSLFNYSYSMRELMGNSIYNCLYVLDDNKNINLVNCINNIELDTQIFKLEESIDAYRITILKKQFKLLTRKENIENEDHKKSKGYQKLKKSMLKCQILQFNICRDLSSF